MQEPQDPRDSPNTLMIVIILCGIFTVMYTLFFPFRNTFIAYDFALPIFGGCCVLGAGIWYLFFRKHQRYLIEIIIFIVVGWGGVIFTVFFNINYYAHSTPEVFTYPVIYNKGSLIAEYKIEITNKDLLTYPRMTGFAKDEIHGYNTAEFRIAKGIFGMKVLVDKEMR
ncbi:MAG: hypothetical protein NTX03_15165 [Bacteroidetes bacterium]|nr:hypothetical protein [Bacteroidota bacterium]